MELQEALDEIEKLKAELAKFEWQPTARDPVPHGTMESAMIGWRTRCLQAEKKLTDCLQVIASLRQDLIDQGCSAVGRR